ncbi:siderophore-iron reductase FhuF [Billgrantia saliphila]|uniref:siderophore-iron reductase FhuF n=1 Tax=Billgrantia saliphila TaxID=1848458 RepID=UPI000CE4F666|nr:siderophore-iron reductase FhuF [Halomonas saliphila]
MPRLAVVDEPLPYVLPQLYVGPLENLAPARLGHDATTAGVAGSDLLDPPYLDELMTRFGRRHGHGDRRAVASLWSKWHFSCLLATGLAANLVLGRDLPLDLDRLRLAQDRDGQTTGLILRHEGQPLDTRESPQRFATLLDGHLAPLIETLAKLSSASPKVFWSNAGNYFEYFAHALAHHPLAPPDANAPALAFLEAAILPDGQRNPLYRPVRYRTADGDEPQRVRRLCCIRYLIDELGYCENCPLTCRARQSKRGVAS